MEKETVTVSLKERGIYIFNKAFNHESCGDAIKWILESNLTENPEYDHLTLVICSYGGSLDACMALIDMMRGSKLPVHTVGLGCIASAGLLAFMAGKHRIVTPNTGIMSHQFTAGAVDKHHDLLAATKRWDQIHERLLAVYKQCTGLSAKVIKEKLMPPSDVWLTAEEAKKLKLVDEIRLETY